MGSCVLEQTERIDVIWRGEQESTPPNRVEGSSLPGVYVPQSGLTPVQELARVLGLWEGDIDEFE